VTGHSPRHCSGPHRPPCSSNTPTHKATQTTNTYPHQQTQPGSPYRVLQGSEKLRLTSPKGVSFRCFSCLSPGGREAAHNALGEGAHPALHPLCAPSVRVSPVKGETKNRSEVDAASSHLSRNATPDGDVHVLLVPRPRPRRCTRICFARRITNPGLLKI